MLNDLSQLTQKLVSIRSDYPNRDEYEMGDFLSSLLEEMGFKIELQYLDETKKRFNVFATRGSGAKAVLFYGHLDTVPLTDEELWTHKPFGGEIVRDHLFGLGSYDMKGGIAAFLYALQQQKDSYVKVFFAFDEENISEGAWIAVQNKKEFFKDVAVVISPEPNFGLGINNIPTARPGRSVYKVELKAKGSHVAEYMQGKDAILDLASFIQSFNETFHNKKKPFFISKYSFAMIRKIFSESVGITAPSEALAEIEVYLDQSDSEEAFLQSVRSLTDAQVNVVPRKTPYLKAYRFQEFPYKELLEKIINQHTGKNFTNYTYGAVGDDNVVASLGVPVLTWGPDGGNAHVADEFVDLISLKHLSEMFGEFLRSL